MGLKSNGMQKELSPLFAVTVQLTADQAMTAFWN